MSFHNEYDNGMEDKYTLPFYRQGVPTSPQTPNQIQELSKAINMGVKNVEVGTISPDVFDTIPTQHFEEMRRLAKLTGSKTSVHAPIIDAAGFTQQGWSEQSRRQAEGNIKSVLDRAHILDPEGNIPVTMHATGAMLPGDRYITDKYGNKIKESILAVNRDTGKLIDLNLKKKFSLRGERDWTPEKQLESINDTEWEDKKLDLASTYHNMENMNIEARSIKTSEDFLTLQIKLKQEKRREYRMTEEEKQRLNLFITNLNSIGGRVVLYREDVMRKIDGMYDTFMKNKPVSRKDKIQYKEGLGNLKELKRDFLKDPNKFKNNPNLLFNEIAKIDAPTTWVSSEEFNKEKAGETIANNAFYAYKKYGDRSPVISIENVYGENVSSRAETLKGLIIEGRKKFRNKLVKEKGLGKKQATHIAESLIGATWDLGHINLLRKQGFTEKDIVKEAKKIAPYVKHVHITDNFGFSDSHLPPGMGNVPIKGQLKEIAKEAKDVRHIVEAGAYAGQFKDNPIPYTLEHMNSPIYQYEAGPSWSNARDAYGSYMNMGDILPSRYFSEFGAGFAKLPKELGGQLWNERSKFSGTPNQ